MYHKLNLNIRDSKQNWKKKTKIVFHLKAILAHFFPENQRRIKKKALQFFQLGILPFIHTPFVYHIKFCFRTLSATHWSQPPSHACNGASISSIFGVSSLHGHGSTFEYFSTKYFFTSGRCTLMIFLSTTTGFGWCLTISGRTSTAPGRLMITGAGRTRIAGGAFTTTLCGFRSTTIGGCCCT